MEDDRVALSPKRQPAEKIVSQPNKSFEDLLEEAVSARKKKKKRGGKKKLKLLKTSSANDEENSADLVGETFKDGVINLGAELEDEGRVPGAPVAMSSGKLRPARNSIVVLAPIKPTRRRATTSSPPPSEPDNNKTANEECHLNGKSSPWDNEEQGRLDATVLNVVETSAVDSPARSCKSLKSSKEGSAPRSPTKSAHSLGSTSVSSSPVSLNSASPTAPQTKRRRRKLTRAHNQLQEMNVPIEMTPLRASSREAGAKSPIEESQNTMLSVRIHLCEIPLATMPAAGIFLRVHVFDTETGSALKTTQDQSVPSASTGLVSKFRGKLALVEQELNFEAPLQLALENNVVLFFELLVPKLNNYSSCYARLDIQERCIGWAFLKLRSSSTGQYNTDAKLRLQIYEASGLPKFSPSQPFKTVHGWWSKGPWKKTRCSVFVTVGGSAAVGNSRRNYNSSRKSSKTASNCDVAADDGPSRDAQSNSRTTLASHSKSFEPILLRKEGHLCKVTDKFSKPLSAPTYNCLSAAFSESGSLLAAAANQNIHIFQAADFGLKCVLQGHEGLIYCVSWLDEKWLVTSSADCLAIVWDTVSETISKMLPHPSFVYCAKFVPGEKNAIITGSKDKTLRVWCSEEDDDEGEYDLWQELDGHQGFVTAMCFDGSAILYSADSEGLILSWAKSTDKSTRQHDWLVQREFLLPDLKGVSISALQVHPSGKRIFISARDSVVRMLDVLTGVVLQNYLGALSHKIQTDLCLSPCGSLLMAGSEDGSVVVWQADTGKVITCLSSPDCPPATALAFHPSVHLLAVGHFGHNPINLWIPTGKVLLN
ncbi:jouberin-like isoform X2 [Neocloeon triangulifer]|uniref:jouberin-like isoform X2 n=1 Tax=Neocloeon triangulifer TaxID=2078957 RepID=UPI00286EF628|nr:jouberin-like isoform X2 [Neocloeon triangulifer]